MMKKTRTETQTVLPGCGTELSSWSSVLFENLTVAQIVKNFPAFYGIRKFITVFTTARNSPLSWARCIHSTPSHPISILSILVLRSHPHLDFPSGLFPSGFPTKFFYEFLIPSIRATCVAHLIFLDMINLIISGDVYKLLSICLNLVTCNKSRDSSVGVVTRLRAWWSSFQSSIPGRGWEFLPSPPRLERL
jgi:hypothetical protein